jgi:hypothetical protein
MQLYTFGLVAEGKEMYSVTVLVFLHCLQQNNILLVYLLDQQSIQLALLNTI